MARVFEWNDLNTLLKSKGKHDTGKALDVLPFLSKRTGAIKDHFGEVLGDYIRNICELEIDEKSLKNQDFHVSEKENKLSEQIASAVEFTEDDDKYDFVRFLDEYLLNQDNINPIHPYLFNYIKVGKKNKNEFGKYAQFMKDVLIQDNQEIKLIFNNKASDDILTELILSNLNVLKDKEPTNQQYETLLRPLSKLYQEDLIYLSNYKEYFLNIFSVLTHFYCFMYICQLVVKFGQFTDADYNSVQPLYFGLDWESVGKRRKAVDGLEGFKFIKENLINIFPHIHTMSQLSHNCLNQGKDRIHFMNYNELYSQISGRGIDFENEFLSELKEWIKEYSNWAKIDINDQSKTLPEAFRVLFKCLKEGTSTTVADKFGKNLEDLGANQFLKIRGSSGQVLNIKHDFLILLTAISVKDKRIPLNELFAEFEKRGVAFDRYSKKEIISLFDKLNIIDKKSDSGDAQYVKPIL